MPTASQCVRPRLVYTHTRIRFNAHVTQGGARRVITTPTEEEIADALTKPLAFTQFQKFRDILVTDVAQSQGLRKEEES